MTYETILLGREDAVATVTLNRPDKLNAINGAMIEDLIAAFGSLEKDESVRAVIVTGAGEKAFAAGADIAAMTEMGVAAAKRFSDRGHLLMDAMERAHFPVIGAVNGFALGGGCELALACDFLYGSEKAKFGQPEVGLGIVPGFGGTQRLARRVGIARARELCFTGDMVGAEDALRLGILNGIAPAAELLPRVAAIARKIVTKGPVAIAQCKRLLLRGADVPLPVANEMEAQCFGAVFGTADQKEGMKAFAEKRTAVFMGK